MPPIAVDLFCGSGGVTAGLKAAGWDIAAALDYDPIAAATYRQNHPEVSLVQNDIESGDAIAEVVSAVGDKCVDLLVICAPCQPFSSQNKKRGHDQREQLILKSLAVVDALRPKLIFFENVPGLAGPSHRYILESLRARLDTLGYQITDPIMKDAASFGVPQRRRRCIMVAATSTVALEAFLASDVSQPKRTVHSAIADLVPLKSGERLMTDKMHRARNHADIVLKRLAHIPHDGGSRRSLPSDLELDCHKGTNSYPDVYGRMSWNEVAPTLTTGCTDVTRGRYAHPEQNRAITLREAARLQTFDDEYQFKGNASQIATQIGNAVPPAMVAALSKAFENALAV
jgi:DNA (cytosine-5)-methyltransferase 1